MEVSTTSSTELEPSSSLALESRTLAVSTILSSAIFNSTVLFSIALDTSISMSFLDSVSILVSIPSIRNILVLIASPTISTIISIPDSKATCTKAIEPKAQPCMRLLSGKEIEDDADLDEEIEIPKWDFDNAIVDQMQIASQLLQNKEK